MAPPPVVPNEIVPPAPVPEDAPELNRTAAEAPAAKAVAPASHANVPPAPRAPALTLRAPSGPAPAAASPKAPASAAIAAAPRWLAPRSYVAIADVASQPRSLGLHDPRTERHPFALKSGLAQKVRRANRISDVAEQQRDQHRQEALELERLGLKTAAHRMRSTPRFGDLERSAAPEAPHQFSTSSDVPSISAAATAPPEISTPTASAAPPSPVQRTATPASAVNAPSAAAAPPPTWEPAPTAPATVPVSGPTAGGIGSTPSGSENSTRLSSLKKLRLTNDKGEFSILALLPPKLREPVERHSAKLPGDQETALIAISTLGLLLLLWLVW